MIFLNWVRKPCRDTVLEVYLPKNRPVATITVRKKSVNHGAFLSLMSKSYAEYNH